VVGRWGLGGCGLRGPVGEVVSESEEEGGIEGTDLEG
jgi:hypothetical protein